MLYGLDLFTGIGGLSIALEAWVKPVAYCERDLYAISVLFERMRTQDFPLAPICTDVRELRGEDLGKIDIIFGGFPCQDLSVAGNGVGLGGERSGLYWEVHRLVKEIQPPFVFLENVPAIRTRGLKEVVGSLAEIGYDCRWTSVSAAAVGAPHRRERWFLLAHTNGNNLREQSRRRSRESWKEAVKFECNVWWEVEPDVGRVVDGLPFRVERTKCLGNAVVPVQAKTAFERLMGMRELSKFKI